MRNRASREGLHRTPSRHSRDYIEAVAARLPGMAPSEIAARVEALVQQDAAWRARTINLFAAESILSRNARRMLDSDLATRLTEGFPGDKEFPPPAHNVRIDEIEALIIAQMRRLLGARHVEWRPVNTTMANAAVLFALTSHGDSILAQSMEGGANMSYHPGAIPTLRGLRVVPMRPTWEYEIDVAAVRRAAREERPAMLVVGGSYCLFPYPVAELREIADEVGAYLFYDAAHLGLFLAAGEFQDPLGEGAHVVSMSTHKTMSGPVGGALITNDDAIAEKLLGLTFPGLIQTRDQNKYAAQAYVLAELAAFGRAYARQSIANAQALGGALERAGFVVLGRDRGYTRTHQVFLDLRQVGAARCEEVCQEAGLLVHVSRLMGDGPDARNGSRLAVHEVTRFGMGESEMEEIADLMRRLVLDGQAPADVAPDVAALAARFPVLSYSFDTEPALSTISRELESK